MERTEVKEGFDTQETEGKYKAKEMIGITKLYSKYSHNIFEIWN